MDLENCKKLYKEFLDKKDILPKTEEELENFSNLKKTLIKCINCFGCFSKDELIELNSCGDAEVEEAAKKELIREY